MILTWHSRARIFEAEYGRVARGAPPATVTTGPSGPAGGTILVSHHHTRYFGHGFETIWRGQAVAPVTTGPSGPGGGTVLVSHHHTRYWGHWFETIWRGIPAKPVSQAPPPPAVISGTRLILRIQHVDRYPYLKVNTLSVRDLLNQRNTCEFTLQDQMGALNPQPGQVVEILHGVEIWSDPALWSHLGLSGFSAAEVNNGNVGGLAFSLETAGVGAYLKLDLGAGVTRAFRACRIWATGSYTATWSVQYSDDDSVWTTAVSGWNSGIDAELSSINWPAVGAHRYWRLSKTDAAAPGGTIREVQFGTEPQIVLFAGTLDRVTKERPAGGAIVYYRCEAVDWHQLADRRLLAKEYVEQSADAIVKDVVQQLLAAEGVKAAAFVESAPTIPKYLAPYLTASEIFQELAELVGYSWYIDGEKRVHFFPRETNRAAFDLASDNGSFLAGSLSEETTREQYRNVQWVRGGEDISDTLTEEFAGDGKTRTFGVSLPIAEVPTIKVNGVVKTVGIRSVDTAKDWYWQEGSEDVSQDTSGPVLTAGDTLRVEFKGLFPVIVTGQNDDEVAARAGVEGGTGLYESIEDDQKLDGQAALDKVQALLRKYGVIPSTVTYETDSSGLAAGQIQTITLPEYNVSGDWLITEVSATDLSGQRIRYSVTAVDGEDLGGWVEFFKKLADRGKIETPRENEVVRLLRTFPETVTCIDAWTVTQNTFVCFQVGAAQVGFAEVCGA
ncbi:hypothetical protein [Candidatus Nitrospira bockiana]